MCLNFGGRKEIVGIPKGAKQKLLAGIKWSWYGLLEI
jgi:hypothetical protein